MSLVCDFIVVGPVQTNCYFLFDKETKDITIYSEQAIKGDSNLVDTWTF